MANRLLIGKSTRGTGGADAYGMYISRPTKNVVNCPDDELIFDTDNGVGASRIHGLFMFGAVSVDGSGNTTTNASVNVNASSTATVAIDQGYNYAHGFIGFGSFSQGSTDDGNSSFIDFTTSGSNLVVTNNTTSNLSGLQVFVLPQFSSNALF
ncbi:MAG: hypothetical protein GOVbin3695_55 [Prokaryotic dsDNA virus sp.]|nr:MAG: hypothetical protein GOVbin3695_55 [Prokaryotic dsDNA virus sp.]|tara:strand:+ start:2251 stop:2709 length:459 start_codon:yes stop_codon:yes gene_type:complete